MFVVSELSNYENISPWRSELKVLNNRRHQLINYDDSSECFWYREIKSSSSVEYEVYFITKRIEHLDLALLLFRSIMNYLRSQHDAFTVKLEYMYERRKNDKRPPPILELEKSGEIRCFNEQTLSNVCYSDRYNIFNFDLDESQNPSLQLFRNMFDALTNSDEYD